MDITCTRRVQIWMGSSQLAGFWTGFALWTACRCQRRSWKPGWFTAILIMQSPFQLKWVSWRTVEHLKMWRKPSELSMRLGSGGELGYDVAEDQTHMPRSLDHPDDDEPIKEVSGEDRETYKKVCLFLSMTCFVVFEEGKQHPQCKKMWIPLNILFL